MRENVDFNLRDQFQSERSGVYGQITGIINQKSELSLRARVYMSRKIGHVVVGVQDAVGQSGYRE